MKLRFLGVGAAYNPSLGSNTAFFMLKDQLYLLDCGESTFERVISLPELTICRAVNVLVTHLHADHIGSLSSFISYCGQVLKKPVLVATPDVTLRKILKLMGIQPDDYAFRQDFIELFPGELKVTPVLVDHDPGMDCYGYCICDGEETIFYSGDANTLPPQILNRFLNKEIARVYQETTYQKKGNVYHCSLEQLCDIVPPVARSRVVCMHFNGDFFDAVQSEGFQIARPVVLHRIAEEVCDEKL